MTTSPSSKNQRRAELVRLLIQPVDDARHPTVDQLAMYIESQLAGLPYQTEYADLAHHLDTCVACAEAYARLYELVHAEQQTQTTTPSRIPEADLAFLQPVSQATWLEQIRAAIVMAGEQLTLQLDPALLPRLQPAVATGTLRAAETEARYQEQILELNEEALPLTMAAYRDKQQPDHCLLEITVAPPGVAGPN